MGNIKKLSPLSFKPMRPLRLSLCTHQKKKVIRIGRIKKLVMLIILDSEQYANN